MGIADFQLAANKRSTTTAEEIARAKGSVPSVFRLDDDYDAAQMARALNRFTRDTIAALRAIASALERLESRVAALEAGE